MMQTELLVRQSMWALYMRLWVIHVITSAFHCLYGVVSACLFTGATVDVEASEPEISASGSYDADGDVTTTSIGEEPRPVCPYACVSGE